ncbi:radical SAM protein, partial [Nonomuraea sp. NPDC055795]
GAYVSRDPQELLAEADWLAHRGVRELVLVSENSTSYGKDLGDLRALEKLLPKLAATEGIERVRASYLQPAELRPGLIDVLSGTEGIAPYFDLSFQHASGSVLRRMRRFGDPKRFLELLDAVRDKAPEAGVRSNFIVGFPGETEEEFGELVSFLEAARLDVIGVFGYSDEDGTEAASMPGKLAQDVVDERVRMLTELAEELTAQRAEERIGTELDVLIEEDLGDGGYEGRAAHQGPEVDGSVTVQGIGLVPGQIVRAVAVDAEGVDLIARIKAGP